MPDLQTEPDLNQVFNLSRATVMVVDDDPFSLKITSQALLAFGMRASHQYSSAEAASPALMGEAVDLLIVDAEMPGLDGYELVRQVRLSGHDPNAFVPVIMLASHTRQSRVTAARDCGANFIVAKPISPALLLERILWVARQPRQFLQTTTYSGPDRRFNEAQPREDDERRGDMRARLEHAARQIGLDPAG